MADHFTQSEHRSKGAAARWCHGRLDLAPFRNRGLCRKYQGLMKVPREAAEGGGSFGGSDDGSAFINGALIGISEKRHVEGQGGQRIMSSGVDDH